MPCPNIFYCGSLRILSTKKNRGLQTTVLREQPTFIKQGLF